MNEERQITFMQARLSRLASDRWGLRFRDAVALFAENHVFEYIHDCFDYLHLEGDEAVLDDIDSYLGARGVRVHD